MEYFTIGIISYLMGSIPFGLILTRVFLKKDIRDIGSGNIGATNVLRTGNKLIGYTTLILDISKAIIPVIFVKINFPELIFVASLCAFLGHVFPIWLKFKGGKGVATYVGILFSINILLGTIFIISWIVIFILTKYSSLSSIIGAISIPLYFLLTGQSNNVIFFIIMFVLIFFTHRENIKRLKNKEESKTKIY
jgi:glycerol-3-phosphate acyltransferase PlsY